MSTSHVIPGPAVLYAGTGTFATLQTLGLLEGGCEVTIGSDDRAQVIDRYGSSPIDYIHVGDKMEVKAKCAEWVLANIQRMGIGLSASGYQGIGRAPGYTLSQAAFTCTIRPLAQALTSNQAFDIVMYKAVQAAAAEQTINLNADGDAIWEINLKGLVDTNRTDGEQIGRIYAPAS